MLELVLTGVFLAATGWIAVRAFHNPKAVYLRSLIGFFLGLLAAIVMWWFASPLISNEAGLGAFVLFCSFVALSAFVAILACIAASLRHVLNAFAYRRR
jgi:heme A synthase